MFAVPAIGGEVEENRLNHFLKTVRVVDVDRRLEVVGGVAHWCFCVSFLPFGATTPPSGGSRGEKREKVDYKAKLSPEVFARFEVMRKVRRNIAKEAAVQAYLVFTDAELAEIAALPQLNVAQIAKIDGIGPKRTDRFGELFVSRFLKEFEAPNSSEDEKSGAPF